MLKKKHKYLSIISSKLPFESSPAENDKYSIAETKILYLTWTLWEAKKNNNMSSHCTNTFLQEED